ncbi:unnamed protein product, partial [Mesorhabditis belari]|uniref:Uncharacterized protein n=1 Tax=Mesorhabditis belari TaxID=2138241 RepID=A0AAF3EVP6_9BILA
MGSFRAMHVGVSRNASTINKAARKLSQSPPMQPSPHREDTESLVNGFMTYLSSNSSSPLVLLTVHRVFDSLSNDQLSTALKVMEKAKRAYFQSLWIRWSLFICLFLQFFNKKSGQRDGDKPIVGNKSGPAEKLEIPRSGAGGSGGPNRLLPPKQQQDILTLMRKGDRHANVLSELQWNTIKADKFAGAARLGNTIPDPTWKELPTTSEVNMRPEELRMVERQSQHAKDIAELDWKTIVVYTAENQKAKQYAGWFGRDHPLNFVGKGEPRDDASLLRLRAVEKVLGQLNGWKYYVSRPVCIVVTDDRFTTWGKDKELLKVLQRDFLERADALTELMAGLQGDVVQFQSIHEKWEVPGWKKAHALIRSKAVRHHPDCPKVKP